MWKNPAIHTARENILQLWRERFQIGTCIITSSHWTFVTAWELDWSLINRTSWWYWFDQIMPVIGSTAVRGLKLGLQHLKDLRCAGKHSRARQNFIDVARDRHHWFILWKISVSRFFDWVTFYLLILLFFASNRCFFWLSSNLWCPLWLLLLKDW